MPKLKLTYFNFHGGRAEPVRLALHIGGVAFEDHRFNFAEFAEVRRSTLQPQMRSGSRTSRSSKSQLARCIYRP